MRYKRKIPFIHVYTYSPEKALSVFHFEVLQSSSGWDLTLGLPHWVGLTGDKP